ncbi:DMT family transporter [Roseibium sp.]|uniref:DMT family transporter n=1 Tax=Roseibium sp. TaxID=1936156 RepID=UPI003D0CE74B
MNDGRTTLLATLTVAVTGILWGFYWIPVRSLTEAGLPGAWGTVVITSAAVLLLSPLAVILRHQFAKTGAVALLSIALGGAAFTLYSIGFVYGRVAIIILLYFLTPVWSAVIGRYVMGWHSSYVRLLAILAGLIGLVVMLSAGGGLPLPRGPGEWMALSAGFLWSVASTGIRAKSTLKPVAAAFVFALGAAVMAVALAPLLEPWPEAVLTGIPGSWAGLALLTGGLWWGASIAALMWATARLEPVRVGILLMTEVPVGAVSAAMLAGEHLELPEIAGGLLVLCAGILEVWPVRRIAGGKSGP